MYFLVHKHVLFVRGFELAHAHWFIQVFHLLGWSKPNANTNRNSDSKWKYYAYGYTNSYSNADGYAYTEFVAGRFGSNGKPATRLNLRLFQRHVHVELC